jgi:hypothetical protein
MRRIALGAFATLLATAAYGDTEQNCQAAWSGLALDAKGKTTEEDFLAQCRKAQGTAGAAAIKPPSDATTKCADGSYSMSPSPAGACEGHGGKADEPHGN